MYIYSGNYAHSSKIVYTFDGKYIYHGNYAHSSKIMYTLG